MGEAWWPWLAAQPVTGGGGASIYREKEKGKIGGCDVDEMRYERLALFLKR